jgi:hypothetical protein
MGRPPATVMAELSRLRATRSGWGELAQTLMGCQPGVMPSEGAYLSTLRLVDTAVREGWSGGRALVRSSGSHRWRRLQPPTSPIPPVFSMPSSPTTWLLRRSGTRRPSSCLPTAPSPVRLAAASSPGAMSFQVCSASLDSRRRMPIPSRRSRQPCRDGPRRRLHGAGRGQPAHAHRFWQPGTRIPGKLTPLASSRSANLSRDGAPLRHPVASTRSNRCADGVLIPQISEPDNVASSVSSIVSPKS